MDLLRTNVFDLPDHLSRKNDPALVAADEAWFATLARTLADTLDDLTQRLDAARRAPARHGQAALDRDQEVHRLTARLRVLRRFGLDVCLGRMVPADGGAPVYVGRLGLTDGSGDRVLVDWRSPAAEPFFGATHADPRGLASRRRYRWTRGRVTDYWDEVFTPDGLEGHAALDDRSAFVASLGGARSARMRDVLGTIQADQDAVVRAGSAGTLVVDGGPGTGKTVVALHRSAYLLHADPRLRQGRGGILFVGPHQPYLGYVADVLPNLGEDGVQICTLRDLVPEGASAGVEADPDVARLKASARLVTAIDAAVGLYEEAPATGVEVATPWGDVAAAPADWAAAFDAVDPGTPHNEAHEQILEALVTALVAEHDPDEVPVERLREALLRNADLRRHLRRSWPLVEATDVVGDLWSVPAYLRRCAPWLDAADVRALQRPDPQAWTVSDLPFLDAARQRLGDVDAARRRARQRAAAAAHADRMRDVVDDLVAADDSEMLVMSMLRRDDLRSALADDSAVPAADPDRLAGPFGHVVVDEAQDLTDAEWQMLLRRCPLRSFTAVGDRAQARHGFAGTWPERLARAGLDRVRVASLTVNYRTPREVMTYAEPVIREVLPDANVPTSVRETGVPVLHGVPDDLEGVVGDWLAESPEGTACVIGAPGFPGSARVLSLTPGLAKGLEFDLVVLVDPGAFGGGVAGAVDRYVAMTRTTGRLVVLTPAHDATGRTAGASA